MTQELKMMGCLTKSDALHNKIATHFSSGRKFSNNNNVFLLVLGINRKRTSFKMEKTREHSTEVNFISAPCSIKMIRYSQLLGGFSK